MELWKVESRSTQLATSYIEHGIPPNEIIVLAGYTAQVALLKRALAFDTVTRDVNASAIEGFQGEETAVAILCIVGSEKLGLVSTPNRLLAGCSRQRDSLVVLCNFDGLQKENSRTRFIFNYIERLFDAEKAYGTYTGQPRTLDFLTAEYRLLATGEQGQDEDQGWAGAQGWTGDQRQSAGVDNNTEGSLNPNAADRGWQQSGGVVTIRIGVESWT